jgi:hypothetical protein
MQSPGQEHGGEEVQALDVASDESIRSLAAQLTIKNIRYTYH